MYIYIPADWKPSSRKRVFVFRHWRWVCGRFDPRLPSDLYLRVPNAMRIAEHTQTWHSLQDSQEDCAHLVEECYLSHICTSRQLHLYSLSRRVFVLAILAH